MEDLGWDDFMRPATPADDALLFTIFATLWEDQVGSMPNPDLVQHFLRIQYIAQDRKFEARFPDHERWVVLHGGQPAGRFYLHRSQLVLNVVDITLLPAFRSLGIGSRIMRMVLDEATEHGQSVCLRMARHNARAAQLYDEIGFRLVSADDQDSYFEWTPELARPR